MRLDGPTAASPPMTEASASRAAGPQTTIDAAPLGCALAAAVASHRLQASPGAIWTRSVKMDASNRAASCLRNLRLRLERQVGVPPQHAHVAHHPALRRQVRGITPLPHLERCDVVRQHAVQERHRVSPLDTQPAARAALPDGGSRTGGVVARVIVAVRVNQSRRSIRQVAAVVSASAEAGTRGTTCGGYSPDPLRTRAVAPRRRTFALGLLQPGACSCVPPVLHRIVRVPWCRCTVALCYAQPDVVSTRSF